MTINDYDMPRAAKVLLFVIGNLNELRQKGYIEGGIPLTDKGFEAFLELQASGFEPTDKELTDAVSFLKNADVEELNKAIGGYGN